MAGVVYILDFLRENCFVSVQDKRILVYVCPLDSSTLSKVMASKMFQFLLLVLRLVNNILVSMKF